MDPTPIPSKSWSIHTRPEITARYSILERVGAGTYSDVYRARRLSDDLTVALKEVHDYQSAFREIEALQTLQHSPNVVLLHEYFWSEDEDAVLVLEFLQTDLASVIRKAKGENGLGVGEIKRWMVQILCGVDACHRSSIVHRDLKPSNLLVSADGVLKLADFGQARILLEPGFVPVDDNPQLQAEEPNAYPPPEAILGYQGNDENSERETRVKKEHGEQKETDEIDSQIHLQDADTSCLATCTTSDVEEDFFKGSYTYEPDGGRNDGNAPLTSCVGTRWFRAPELLYGSTNYGLEVDLWSLGCIFAELLTLEPLFPGTSDIDQLSRIFAVLGNLTKEIWPGCLGLPDYQIISFGKVENQIGLEACLTNRSPDEILLVKKLLHFDPANRATAMELLHERYLNEEPLPVPLSQLRVPSSFCGQDERSGEWVDYRAMSSDSDTDEFGSLNIVPTNAGFSIRFP